ncbi:MAG: transcriptional regulator [Bacteroidetes bacterium]|nr:transcriptional regulator [Bacteroidota bacterium]
MEQVILNKDISVLCVTAESFPMGIGKAFKTLEEKVDTIGRMFYGISRPDRNTIVYKAAVEAKEGEQMEGCEVFIIKKGTYIAHTILDWKKDESSIGKAFQSLLQDTRIDPNGACVEQYLNGKDVICMVRLDDKFNNN